jgi:hypothetical protein
VQNHTAIKFVLQGGKKSTVYQIDIFGPRFRFASTFGDHQVLIRAPQRANILGFGVPGTTVALSLRANITSGIDTQQTPPAAVASGTVSPSGTWAVLLPPVQASPAFKPAVSYTLVATSGGSSIQLLDILIGDVWVASGQSNSELFGFTFSAAVCNSAWCTVNAAC